MVDSEVTKINKKQNQGNVERKSKERRTTSERKVNIGMKEKATTRKKKVKNMIII